MRIQKVYGSIKLLLLMLIAFECIFFHPNFLSREYFGNTLKVPHQKEKYTSSLFPPTLIPSLSSSILCLLAEDEIAVRGLIISV